MNVLDWKGAAVVTVGALVVFLILRQDTQAIAGQVSDIVKKFREGLAFDPNSLGAPVQLTDSAQAHQQWLIDQGYLELLPDGRTRITPAGYAYSDNQARVNQ